MSMSPRIRRLALSVHLTASVGWLGAVVGYLALDVVVATSSDVGQVRAAWIGMGLIVAAVIVPLALGSLVTGLVMALGTKWGLFRHWWVLISFALTCLALAVLLSETRVVTALAARAADISTSDAALLAAPPTLPHSIGGLLVLLVVQVLNVYKPQGVTPYGWRRQQAERQGLEKRAPGAD